MTEWIVILVIVLIFFGAGKLPDVFAQAGKGLKAFKDASEGKDPDVRKGDSEDSEDEPQKKARKQIAKDPDELDDEAEERSAAPQKRERTRD